MGAWECNEKLAERRIGVGVAVLGILLVLGVMGARAAEGSVAGELGQELKKIGSEVLEAGDAATRKSPPVPVPMPPGEEAAAEAAESGPAFRVDVIRIAGDESAFEASGLGPALRQELTGTQRTEAELREILRAYQVRFSQEGYLAGRVILADTDPGDGTIDVRVDAGRVGEIRLRDMDGESAYRGRYYTADQVRRRLDDLSQADLFQYGDFYRGVYALNAHPDLTVDAHLTVREEGADAERRRFVDVDLKVRDRLPLHASIEIQNSGTDVTDEWNINFSAQYLNLTRRDDVLTVTVPFSLDFESLQSGAGSYFLPYHAGNGGSVSLFGGYSEIASDSLVPGIDLDGTGWFTGGQVAYNLVADDKRLIRLGAGIAFSSVEDELLLAGSDTLPREVKRTPLSLALSYAALQPDAWNGRNSLSLQSIFHAGDFLGSSDDAEFELQRENAPSDYFIERIEAARVQGLGATEGLETPWSLVLRLSAQLASDVLIPADQIAMGGRNSVRGYDEREVLGDDGVMGSLELRTPVKRSPIPGWRGRGGTGPAREARLQGIAFVDGGMVSLQEPVAGEDSQVDMVSVGLGFRLGVGRSGQVSFDWGFPLEETAESDDSGRGHVSAQILF